MEGKGDHHQVSQKDFYFVTHSLQDGRLIRLRYVLPYDYVFKTFVKGRWVGRSVSDVFTKEFGDYYNEQYVQNAIGKKRLMINGLSIPSKDTIFRKNDQMSHISHRHELPIFEIITNQSSSTERAKSDDLGGNNNHTAGDIRIEILDQDANFLVVNKPASIPVHPVGRYQKNTVCFMLYHQYGINSQELHVVHRLDRVTSGILIFAKSKQAANTFQSLLSTNSVSKIYIARVSGSISKHFKEGHPFTVRGFMKNTLSNEGKISWDMDTQNQNSSDQDSCTLFIPLSYCEKLNESIVLARPITGRTHQIRVHLKSIGFPITNDFDYHDALGNNKNNNNNNNNNKNNNNTSECDFKIKTNDFVQYLIGNQEKYLDPNCPECQLLKMNVQNDFVDIIPLSKMMIYLHSWCYHISFKQTHGENNTSSKHYETGTVPQWVLDIEPDLNKLRYYCNVLKYQNHE